MSYPQIPADPNRDPAEPFRNLDPAPTTGRITIVTPPADEWEPIVEVAPITADEVVERQRQAFGGMKIGSALFGWITVAGLTSILTGVLVAAGVALGLGPVGDAGTSSDALLGADAVGWVGVSALLAIALVSFYGGGYVAGRMARFSGALQGLAVWLWAVVIAIAVAVISMVLGIQGDLLGALNTFPRISVPESALTIAGITIAVVAALVTVGGALLGGVVGVRYHRRIDLVGFDR
ncbi:MAG TPA: hypothetical protein VIP55_04390 [Agromyces sp.]